MPTAIPPSTEPLLRARTLLALRIASQDLKKHTNAIDLDHGPQELITRTRLLSVLEKRLKCMVIVAARIVHDVPWGDIAGLLSVSEEVAQSLYGPAVTRWQAGDPTPWGPVLSAGDPRVIEGLHPIEINDGNIDALTRQTPP